MTDLKERCTSLGLHRHFSLEMRLVAPCSSDSFSTSLIAASGCNLYGERVCKSWQLLSCCNVCRHQDGIHPAFRSLQIVCMTTQPI